MDRPVDIFAIGCIIWEMIELELCFPQTAATHPAPKPTKAHAWRLEPCLLSAYERATNDNPSDRATIRGISDLIFAEESENEDKLPPGQHNAEHRMRRLGKQATAADRHAANVARRKRRLTKKRKVEGTAEEMDLVWL